MTAKSKNTPTAWVDPDDAPELGDDFFSKATPMIAGSPVTGEEYATAVKKRMGRPPVAVKRPTLNMRIDPDVLEALKASGRGWQTRVNDLLRADIQAGRLEHIRRT